MTPETSKNTDKLLTGLNKLALVMRHEHWKNSTESGIAPTQQQILAALSAHGQQPHGTSHPESGLRVTELARQLGLSQPTVSDSVAALERKRLVHRIADPTDRRAVLVALTSAGREIAGSTAQWPDGMAMALAEMDGTEQAVLLGAVMKMISRLQGSGTLPSVQMCLSCQFFDAYVHGEGSKPHHCRFVDAPLGPLDLRMACNEHELATPAERQRLYQVFVKGTATSEKVSEGGGSESL